MLGSANWPFIQRAFFWTGFLIMVGFILIIGKNLLIPFVIAVFVWYLINALSDRIERIQIRGKHFPRWLALTISIIVLLLFVENVMDLLIRNTVALSKQAPVITQKLNHELAELQIKMGINQTASAIEVGALLNFGTNFLRGLARSVGDTAGKTITIFLYVGFLLAEQGTFSRKLTAIIDNRKQEATTRNTLKVIADKVRSYLLVKTVASLASALLSYIVLRSVGVNLAELWALLVFLLNFIPIIGSAVSLILPTLIALVQFETPVPALIIAGGLLGSSTLVANVVEPRLMGQSLNLSPLAIIFSLALWGTIWGVSGMILAVPIAVLIMIVCAQFPETHDVAILLSQSGKIEVVTPHGVKKRDIAEENKVSGD